MAKEPYAMTLAHLKFLRESGEFHHATYRNLNSLWEGLYIYTRNETAARGFDVAGVFPKGDPDLDTAMEQLRGTGISFGSYGRG